MVALTLDVRRVASSFAFEGSFVDAAPYGSGHINETFAVRTRRGSGQRRFILQKINHTIFKDPVSLVSNIAAVTSHLRQHLGTTRDVDRCVLRLVPTKHGSAVLHDDDGSFWRAYLFVEGASSHDVVDRPEIAREAARAFGAFQAALSDYTGPPLHETIPRFHDTRRRYEAFEDAVADDRAGHAESCATEVGFARARATLAGALLDLRTSGQAPTRVTHNDTKINNVLIDDVTGEGVCVIDLDTVMDGIALFDFGDLVRTAAATAREDERDLRRVDVDLDLFAAIVQGYASAAGSMLTPAEKAHLVTSVHVMTYQQGLRFLADHLQGDPYFRIHRAGHNLDRARTQFRLLERLEEKRDSMERIAEGAFS